MSFDLNAVGMPGDFSGLPAASSSSAADQDAATFQAFMEQHALDLFALFSDEAGTAVPDDEASEGSSASAALLDADLPPADGDERDAASLPYVPGTLASFLWHQAQSLAEVKPEAPPAETAAGLDPSLDEVPLVLDVPVVGAGALQPDDVTLDTPLPLAAAPVGDAIPVVAPSATEPEVKESDSQKRSERKDTPSDAPVDLVKLFLDRAPFLKHEEDEKDGIERTDKAGTGPKVRGPLDGGTHEDDEAIRSSESDASAAADAAEAAALAAAATAATLVSQPAPVLAPPDASSSAGAATDSTPIGTTSASAMPVPGDIAQPTAATPDHDASTLAVGSLDKPTPGTRASADAPTTAEKLPVAEAPSLPAFAETLTENLPADKTPTRLSPDVARALQDRTLPEVKLELPLRPIDIEGMALAASAASSGTGSQPGTSSDSSGHSGSQPNAHAGERAGAIAQRLAQTVQLMAGFERVLESAAIGPTSAPAPPPLANEPQALDSIVKSMRLQHQGGGGTAVIQLDPEFLGGVTVSLQVSRGAVTATLQAERADVRAWLEANEATLREALEQQGLSLDRLVVSEDRIEAQQEASADGRRRESQPPPKQKSRRQGSDDAGTFEVVV